MYLTIESFSCFSFQIYNNSNAAQAEGGNCDTRELQMAPSTLSAGTRSGDSIIINPISVTEGQNTTQNLQSVINEHVPSSQATAPLQASARIETHDCEKCNLRFLTHQTLQSHFCSVSVPVVRPKVALPLQNKHLSPKNKRLPYCKICNTYFPDDSSVADHVAKFGTDCALHKMGFEDYNRLLQHKVAIKRTRFPPKISSPCESRHLPQCKICHTRFADQSTFADHRATFRKNCAECEMCFVDDAQLSQHKATVIHYTRLPLKISLPGGKEHLPQCKMCETHFPDRFSFATHMAKFKTHCALCQMCFADNVELLQHHDTARHRIKQNLAHTLKTQKRVKSQRKNEYEYECKNCGVVSMSFLAHTKHTRSHLQRFQASLSRAEGSLSQTSGESINNKQIDKPLMMSSERMGVPSVIADGLSLPIQSQDESGKPYRCDQKQTSDLLCPNEGSVASGEDDKLPTDEPRVYEDAGSIPATNDTPALEVTSTDNTVLFSETVQNMASTSETLVLEGSDGMQESTHEFLQISDVRSMAATIETPVLDIQGTSENSDKLLNSENVQDMLTGIGTRGHEDDYSSQEGDDSVILQQVSETAWNKLPSTDRLVLQDDNQYSSKVVKIGCSQGENTVLDTLHNGVKTVVLEVSEYGNTDEPNNIGESRDCVQDLQVCISESSKHKLSEDQAPQPEDGKRRRIAMEAAVTGKSDVAVEEDTTRPLMASQASTHKKTNTYGCEKCNLHFLTHRTLEVHFCSVSAPVVNPEISMPLGSKHLPQCKMCKTYFADENSLADHASKFRAHCAQCGMCFEDIDHLLQHKAAVKHGLLPKISSPSESEHLPQCKICKTRFADQSILRKHMATFRKHCAECEMCLVDNPHLLQHKDTIQHRLTLANDQEPTLAIPKPISTIPVQSNVELSFRCKNCQHFFDSKEALEKHVGQYGHQCDICLIYFLSNNELLRHRRKAKHGFRCKLCGKISMSLLALSNHKRYHLEQATPVAPPASGNPSQTIAECFDNKHISFIRKQTSELQCQNGSSVASGEDKLPTDEPSQVYESAGKIPATNETPVLEVTNGFQDSTDNTVLFSGTVQNIPSTSETPVLEGTSGMQESTKKLLEISEDVQIMPSTDEVPVLKDIKGSPENIEKHLKKSENVQITATTSDGDSSQVGQDSTDVLQISETACKRPSSVDTPILDNIQNSSTTVNTGRFEGENSALIAVHNNVKTVVSAVPECGNTDEPNNVGESRKRVQDLEACISGSSKHKLSEDQAPQSKNGKRRRIAMEAAVTRKSDVAVEEDMIRTLMTEDREGCEVSEQHFHGSSNSSSQAKEVTSHAPEAQNDPSTLIGNSDSNPTSMTEGQSVTGSQSLTNMQIQSSVPTSQASDLCSVSSPAKELSPIPPKGGTASSKPQRQVLAHCAWCNMHFGSYTALFHHEYTVKHKLNTHRAHTGQRFCCRKCRKYFNCGDSLLSHVTRYVHHCEMCRQCFISYTTLSRHRCITQQFSETVRYLPLPKETPGLKSSSCVQESSNELLQISGNVQNTSTSVPVVELLEDDNGTQNSTDALLQVSTITGNTSSTNDSLLLQTDIQDSSKTGCYEGEHAAATLDSTGTVKSRDSESEGATNTRIIGSNDENLQVPQGPVFTSCMQELPEDQVPFLEDGQPSKMTTEVPVAGKSSEVMVEEQNSCSPRTKGGHVKQSPLLKNAVHGCEAPGRQFASEQRLQHHLKNFRKKLNNEGCPGSPNEHLVAITSEVSASVAVRSENSCMVEGETLSRDEDKKQHCSAESFPLDVRCERTPGAPSDSYMIDTELTKNGGTLKVQEESYDEINPDSSPMRDTDFTEKGETLNVKEEPCNEINPELHCQTTLESSTTMEDKKMSEERNSLTMKEGISLGEVTHGDSENSCMVADAKIYEEGDLLVVKFEDCGYPADDEPHYEELQGKDFLENGMDKPLMVSSERMGVPSVIADGLSIPIQSQDELQGKDFLENGMDKPLMMSSERMGVPSVIADGLSIPIQSQDELQGSDSPENGMDKPLMMSSEQMGVPSVIADGLSIPIQSQDEPYRCDQCGKCFSRLALLKNHKVRHSDLRRYRCFACTKGFHTRSDLKTHQLTSAHMNSKPHVCEICQKGFHRKPHLKFHMKSHTGEKPYLCEHCGKGFLLQCYLKRHVTVHTGEKKYVCDHCGRAIRDYSAYQVHLKTHTNDRRYVCEECGSRFITKTSCRRHYKTHFHDLTCKVCQKECKKLAALNRHVKMHAQPVVQSSRRSSRKRGLTQQNVFTCEECGKTTHSRSKLKEHRAIHSDNKPFECDKCDKAFRHKYSLKKHLLTHSGVRPYKCKECDWAFYASSDLQSHMNTHAGDRPFQCDVCGINFLRKGTLTVHRRRLHPDVDTLECTECNLKFYSHKLFEAHNRKTHKSKSKP